MRWAVDTLTRAMQPDERGVIVMYSDGAGQGMAALAGQIERGRQRGLTVFGIAAGQHIDLTPAYGADAWIKWAGSVKATAQPLADIIGKAHRGQR